MRIPIPIIFTPIQKDKLGLIKCLQYLESFFRELADAKCFRHSGQNFPRMVDDFVESHVDIVLDPKI